MPVLIYKDLKRLGSVLVRNHISQGMASSGTAESGTAALKLESPPTPLRQPALKKGSCWQGLLCQEPYTLESTPILVHNSTNCWPSAHATNPITFPGFWKRKVNALWAGVCGWYDLCFSICGFGEAAVIFVCISVCI